MPSPKELKRQQKRRKELRRAELVHGRTVSTRTAVKTTVAKARAAIEAGTPDEAVRTAQAALDSAARKGVIHKRAAARRLSRLIKRQRQAKAS